MRAVLTLRPEKAELSRLVQFATEFADRNQLPAEELSRLLLILDELFSNVVRHGYEGAAANGTVEVTLSVARGRLGIEIADDGRPFDPLAAPVPDLDLPASERQPGGLGIHFVRKLVDEARYVRRGRRNRLTLSRRIVRTRKLQ
jgi:anti-sigma regulatory factor (Ser/Thr protein kinase)